MVLGHSFDCPTVSEVTLKDVGKIKERKKMPIVYMILGMYFIFAI